MQFSKALTTYTTRAKWGVALHNRAAHPRRPVHNRVEEGKEGGEVAEGSRVHNRQIISPSPNQTGEPIDLGDRTQNTTTEWILFFTLFTIFGGTLQKNESTTPDNWARLGEIRDEYII